MKIRRRRLLQGGLVALGSAGALSGYLVQRSVAQTTCPIISWPLYAGQTILVGELIVTNDANNIYVTYKLTDPCWVFGTLQVWIGNDLANVPGGRNPAPGPFCRQAGAGGACYDATGLTEYKFTIPFTDLAIQDINTVCSTFLYIFAHADVKNTCDNSEETAWGGGTGVPPGQGKWYRYGTYTICCGNGEPPTPKCTTAFAKGGYVFTTDPKSNPEKLPSLGLIKNRWGWAINLLQAGTTTYDIWAGAGLNNTANGAKVGTLTVTWSDGGGLSVVYTMTGNCKLREVHLYAGDGKPTTVAPGQYGYLDGFETLQSSYEFNVNVPSPANAGIDGIWLIAHAVVCC